RATRRADPDRSPGHARAGGRGDLVVAHRPGRVRHHRDRPGHVPRDTPQIPGRGRVVSPAGAALLRWIDDQPGSAERVWSLEAADLYRCAVSVGRAGDYLAGADLDGLVRRTVALALLRLHPVHLLCLPKIDRQSVVEGQSVDLG